jgi:hypothetical protein
MKPSKNQKKILKALANLPEEMEPEELEALICSLASSYVGFDNVPDTCCICTFGPRRLWKI